MENRRGFIAALASFFGFGAVVQAATPVVPKLEGFVVLFINVGNLPPAKAEDYIEKTRERWNKTDRHPDLIKSWQTIWIPTRTQETHAEFYPINGPKDAEGRLKQLEGLILDYTDAESHTGAEIDLDDPQVKARAIDFALLMLGAPILKIELDQQQLDACFATVVCHIKNTGNAINSVYLTETFLNDGVLAFTKMMLGRVRSKWINLPGPTNNSIVDGPTLIEEAREDIDRWLTKLQEIM